MNVRRGLAGIAAVALVALAAPGAEAATIALEADRDNTLIESATGALSNGAGTGIFAGKTLQASGSLRRALVHFDVAAALPAGATIDSVELALSLTRRRFGGDTLTVHRVLAAWGEGSSSAPDSRDGDGEPSTAGDATWIHRFFPGDPWTSPGGDFAAVRSGYSIAGNVATFQFWRTSPGLVADVQLWLDQAVDNHGWMLRAREDFGGSTKRFASSEATSPSERPTLTIHYTASVLDVPPLPWLSTWGRVKDLYR